MVIGMLGGSALSLGLALPTGWMFGYGYGHGVRSGYHAFRPSKNKATRDLHLSMNPVTGAGGAGLLSAEEMTQRQAPKLPIPMSGIPAVGAQKTKLDNSVRPKHTMENRLWNRAGTKAIQRYQRYEMSRSYYKRWYEGDFHWGERTKTSYRRR